MPAESCRALVNVGCSHVRFASTDLAFPIYALTARRGRSRCNALVAIDFYRHSRIGFGMVKRSSAHDFFRLRSGVGLRVVVGS